MNTLPFRFLITLLTSLMCALALPAAGQELLRTVDVKTNYNIKPRFFSKRPLTVNQGRQLYIGKSGDYDDESVIFLVDLKSGKKFQKEVPIAEFFSNNPELLINSQVTRRRGRSKKEYKTFGLNKLFFYDEANGSAGILIKNQLRIDRVSHYRYIYLHWDLKANRITRGWFLSEYAADRGRQSYTIYSIYTVAYNHETDTLYLAKIKQVYTRKKSIKGGEITIESFSHASRKKIVLFTTTRNPAHSFIYHHGTQTAFFAQYAEGFQRAVPKGYFINLENGTLKTCLVPGTAYGQAFSADGKTLYLASNETGKLWVINRETGRLLKKFYVGKKGHALDFVKKDTLLWIRHAGLQFINTKTLRRGRFISMKKYLSGFIHIEGSMVLPGMALVKNRGKLYMIKAP